MNKFEIEDPDKVEFDRDYLKKHIVASSFNLSTKMFEVRGSGGSRQENRNSAAIFSQYLMKLATSVSSMCRVVSNEFIRADYEGREDYLDATLKVECGTALFFKLIPILKFNK